MKTLMMTTAIAMATATTAFADAHISNMSAAGEYEASDLIGMRLYAGDANGMNDDWNDIGEINDLMISVTGDGQLGNAIVGVGGFIGIGEKDVALGLDRISRVTDADGETFLVVSATQEELEAMVEYVPADERDDMADMDMAETEMDSMMDPENTVFVAPAVDLDGYEVATVDELTSDDLDGARVYSTNDEDIGEIKSLVLSEDGQITKARLDVGGFLGMGEKQIEVDFSEITIMRGDDFRIYVDATQEQLESREQYNE